MSKAATFDKANSDGQLASRLLFSRDNRLLGDHPITQGRDSSERVERILTFTGQSLKGPRESIALLALADSAVDRPVGLDGVVIKDASKAPRFRPPGGPRGVALTLGKGRVVVLGEAGMLSAQLNGPKRLPMGMNARGNDNRQFALNIMHWLSNLPGLAGSNGGPVASAPAQPATAPAAATPAAATPGRPMTTAEIVRESEPSIALVKGKSGSGTGFLVRPGVLATNAHVIDDEFISGLEIRFPSAAEDKKGPYTARLLYEDNKRDLALLAVKVDLPPLRIAPSYTFQKGEDITVIGNPGAGGELVLENAISRGVMSTRTRLDAQDFYQLGIAINPGNSGGPVFDSSGQVIGVATRASSKKDSLAFSIPVGDLHAAIEKQGRESSADTDRVGSQHRLANAVRGLSGGGAWYCLGIDAFREAGPGKPLVKKAARSLTTAIAELDKDWFPTLFLEVAGLRKDRLVVPAVQDKFAQLADNFDKLKAAYQGKQTRTIKPDDLKQMKLTHRQLTASLFSTLKLELPEGLLEVFEDRPMSQRYFSGGVAARGERRGSALTPTSTPRSPARHTRANIRKSSSTKHTTTSSPPAPGSSRSRSSSPATATGSRRIRRSSPRTFWGDVKSWSSPMRWGPTRATPMPASPPSATTNVTPSATGSRAAGRSCSSAISRRGARPPPGWRSVWG